MSYPEMHFSEKMDIVMKTIWYLRSSTGKKKLRHTEVERISALFATERPKEKGELDKTGAEKGVTRQSWLKSNASVEWHAIRDAIAGKLSPSHPVECRIAEFAKGDKAGRFHEHIQKLDSECVGLRQKLKEAEDRFADFELLVLQEQYLASHDQIHLKKFRKDLESKTKELNAKDKILNSAQAEADSLRADNEKLRKNAGATEVVENAKHRLYEPELSALVNVPDGELLGKYLGEVRKKQDELLSLFQKGPRPKDVVLVFHTFNIDLPRFVRTSVPFRHTDRNVVFACFQPSDGKRSLFYEDVATLMDPFKPRVFIIVGGTPRQSDMDKAAKVINIVHKPGDVAIYERLWDMTARQFKKYDVVDEGYGDVKIVRVTNG